MEKEYIFLILTAASLGIIHTAIGPDHYVPFIALAKANNWSMYKVIIITALCGVGHILSYILIGLIGAAFGLAINSIETIESIRGDIASWSLIAFGLVYLIWGFKKAYIGKPHTHFHFNKDKHLHYESDIANYKHKNEHTKNNAAWILFVIFVFGPCEVLIPLFMYMVTLKNTSLLILVTGVFGIATILTMLGTVSFSLIGLKFFHSKKLEKYSHAIAGIIILICGVSIKYFSL